MTAALPPARPRYVAPPPGGTGCACALVWCPGTPGEQRYAFHDQIQIGRDDEASAPAPGQLLIADPTVSRRHCVIRHAADGRCFARDVSRNGTRIDGRRMVPNVEVEVRRGERLSIGTQTEFVFEGSGAVSLVPAEAAVGRTVGVSGSSMATVLVGDIRDYTTLVRRAPPVGLQHSVNRVFEILSGTVTELGGTVKEYHGDALLAFWEGSLSGTQAVKACRAALALDHLARTIGSDAAVWELPDFLLQIDWALATGPVVLDSFGGLHPTGLSLIGEPVVLAFRLEKFATDATGRVLACPVTKVMAGDAFTFRDLGEMQAKGFDRPDHVFALDDERQGESEGRTECGQ